SEVHLRVYERGAGETLACGTGASAAVVAGRILGLLDERILVHLPGGDLVVKWHSEGQPVLMQGPAETVYEGTIEL
ncbi:MAG: diaminopimelate epimerase, partial [Candidatus Thiodiazotropha sp. (ex Lucinoma borealis)]|nr:diaminopimelate epimerase [Candidatus Thiodiazotropha sp. (ex Lucinoma borealis)]